MPEQIKKSLSQRLKTSIKLPEESVWKGPEDSGSQGGITQSMLSDFIVCRERFRLRVVEGLDLAPAFSHRLEYGSMWHVCEEAHSKEPYGNQQYEGPVGWQTVLYEYAKKLCQKYRIQQEQIQHWYNVCKVQFPIYMDYWRKHQDVKDRTPLLQEQVFHVPYGLPSGRTVYLRGRWDSVDLIGKGKSASVYLQENKTKGDIKEEQLKRQLQSGFDLQTMFYLVALRKYEYLSGFVVGGKSGEKQTAVLTQMGGPVPISGVRYNVVRRPLSGGRHSIVQHKPKKNGDPGETPEEFYARLGSLIASEPEYFFMRWKIEISQADIDRFRRECLDPLLEQLCDWWEHVSQTENLFGPEADIDWPYYYHHWRTPYGTYNILAEGGSADVDEYLNTGSDVGLIRGKPLFGELQDA